MRFDYAWREERHGYPTPHERDMVFIDYYSPQDKETAKRICDDLDKAGIDTRVEFNGLHAGQHISTAIENAIRKRSGFLMIISKHSALSSHLKRNRIRFLQDYVQKKEEKQLRVLPVLLDEPPPIEFPELAEIQF